MDENSNPRSASLGVFIVMSVVPIVGYLIAVLALPWIARVVHVVTAPFVSCSGIARSRIIPSTASL
jgi:hypothetical protein